MTALVLALLVGALAPGVGFAWPSDLDPTFGSAGKVLTAVLSDARAGSAVLQPDGRIVVAGLPEIQGIPMARYETDGTLDPSFGSGGTVIANVTAFEGVQVVLQPDGKLVIATVGQGTGGDDFLLIRFRPDGTLDPTFGSGGIVTTDFQGGVDGARGLVLQPDGKIVAVGYAQTGTYFGDPATDFALARYNPDGSLDASFGTGGKVTTDLGRESEKAIAVVLQADGRIVVAGNSITGLYFDYAVLARYDASGMLDPSFGSGGTVESNEGHFLVSLLLQADGRFVVGELGALLRYDPDGSPDPTFGTGGSIATITASGLLQQPDGKLVAVGGIGALFGLQRYSSDASVDPAFAACGDVVTAFGNGGAVGTAAVLQPDGKIVAAGMSCPGDSAGCRFALARYGGPPAAACSTAVSVKTSLLLRHSDVDGNDFLRLKWFSGGTLDRTEFGDPTATADMTLCLLDDTGTHALQIATAPAGEECGTRPCWAPTRKGYRYRSISPPLPDGLSPIILAAGSAGKGKIFISGRNGSLVIPPLPLATPLVVRVKRSDGAQCWEAIFSQPRVNTQQEFLAAAD